MPEEEKADNAIRIILQLAQAQKLMPVIRWEPLAQSGSHRIYYRLYFADDTTLIGTYNQDVAENRAFFAYTNFFVAHHFPVPQLLSIASDQQHYLQTDLGDFTLYDFLSAHRENGTPSADVENAYLQVVRTLPKLQLSGKQGFDFSVAYPRAAFDRQSMQWDLNYFKYYFLKLVNVPFNEQSLENDYNTLINYLLSADSEYFLYRDFQSRNIMVQQNDIYFIDYQGGRKGALPYDIASLLYDAKADLSQDFRDYLLENYLKELSKYMSIDKSAFIAYLQGFVLIRILQSMGTYGYRGYFERKSHFLQSVPYAVHNMDNLLNTMQLPIQLPALTKVLRRVIDSDFVHPYQPAKTLTVLVQSFSYKKGIPADPSPNGGGYVFDCRALPNPGREKRFAQHTGKDQCVIDYLSCYPAIDDFKKSVFSLVDMSVDNYLDRHFDHLMVSFGCTGGQHRSVFFAEQTAAHLREKYHGLNIVLNHTAL